jgi:hypothetical protein
MQTWPPSKGLYFLERRWYDSSTLGVYDPITNVTCDPAGGSMLEGLVLTPFQQWANEPRKFVRIGLDIDAVGASPNLLLGIYETINGFPGRLLHAAPATAVTGIGALEIAFPSTITLAPGPYWLAFMFDGAVEVAGWEGDATAGPAPGFPTIGNPTPDTTVNTLKQFGWEVTGLPFGLPQTLTPLPGGATLNDGFIMPRLCLEGGPI